MCQEPDRRVKSGKNENNKQREEDDTYTKVAKSWQKELNMLGRDSDSWS